MFFYSIVLPVTEQFSAFLSSFILELCLREICMAITLATQLFLYISSLCANVQKYYCFLKCLPENKYAIIVQVLVVSVIVITHR